MRQSLLPVFCQLVVLCDGVHPRSPLWLLACLHVVHNYRLQKVYFGSGRTDCVLRSPFLNTYAWCINIVWGIYGTVSVILFNPCRETRAQNHFGNSRHTTGRRFEMSQCAKFSVRIRAKKNALGCGVLCQEECRLHWSWHSYAALFIMTTVIRALSEDQVECMKPLLKGLVQLG